MRLNYFYYVLIVLLFFTSCTIRKTQLVKSQEFIYQTGFPDWDPCGVFYDKENNTEYVYFASMAYKKKLLFFSLGGEKLIEIPTDSISDWRTANGIFVTNLDTIVFIMGGCGTKNIRIIFMDKQGNCFKKIDINDVVQTDENNRKYNTSYGNIFENGVFFLKTSPADYSYQIKHKSHVLLKYDIQTGEYQYALSDMWRRICTDTNLYIQDINFAVENNILFVYSQTGNMLYLLNKNTYKINKKIKIVSSYTDIGVEPRTIEDISMEHYEREVPLHGQLVDIEYDNYNRLYYVFIRHADSSLKNDASFSIQIYNKKFKKLSEQVFDGKEYKPNYMICSQGLLLRNNSSRRDYDDSTKIKYDLYKIKK